jgi:hypothetical protein
MANQKVTQLTLGTPSATDVFNYVENPSGAPVSKKAYIKNTITQGTVDGHKFACSTGAPFGGTWIPDNFGFTYTFGDGSGTIVAGTFTPVEMSVAGSIDSIRLFSGTVNGSGTIDVYKWNYSQAGTIVYGTAFSIFGTATKPSTAGTNRFEGTAYSGAQYTFNKGDWILPVMTGCGTIKELSVAFGCRKTAVS